MVAKRIPMGGMSHESYRRLDNEVKICATLRHDFVVQYLRTLHEAEWLTVLMEYAAGGSLKERLQLHRESNAPFEPITVATWLSQVRHPLH